MGYKVLFCTTEMSTELVMRRIDALWNGFSYTRFRDGKLYPDEYERFKLYLEEMEGNEEVNLVVEQITGGISQISAKIDQYSPDVVYIDGGYLLEDEEGGDDDWKGLVRIWRGIHKLALAKRKPIVISTQSKERKVTLSAIAFASAIRADSDVILALEQDEQQFNDREIGIKPLKIREGELFGKIINAWDFNNMNYEEIYNESDGRTQSEEKTAEEVNKVVRANFKTKGRKK